jgi:hypothetical protein
MFLSMRKQKSVQGKLMTLMAIALGATCLAACASMPSASKPATATAAKAGLVIVSDLPHGWQAGTVNKGRDTQTLAIAAGIKACHAYVAQAKRDKQQIVAYSPTFAIAAKVSKANNSVSNEVVGYKNAGIARAAYATYSGEQGQACMKLVFKRLAAQAQAQVAAQATAAGQQGSSVSVSSSFKQLSVPQEAEGTTAYSILLKLSYSGQSELINFVFEIALAGPYVVTYNASLYSAPPAHWENKMVASSIARLQAA